MSVCSPFYKLESDDANSNSEKIESDDVNSNSEKISTTVKTTTGYSRLKEAMENDFLDDLVVILEPRAESRDYTLEEVEKVRRRPFASRLYLSRIVVDWNSVWLRTHFTECHEMESSTRRFRDLAKCAIFQNNSMAAYSIVADLMILLFSLEKTQYYSLATTLASALSNYGEGITFQSKIDEKDQKYLVRNRHEQGPREKLTALVNILFRKISIEAHVVKNDQANIYRIAYCMIQSLPKNTPNRNKLLCGVYLKTGVSIVSQMALTTYIFLQVKFVAVTINLEMLPLAVVTLVLSCLLVLPEFRAVGETSRLYQRSRWHPLALIDYISNLWLPLILSVAGFLIVAIAEDYIDGVLNATALLFISEIDDLMIGVFDLDAEATVHNHLIAEAFSELTEAIEKFEKLDRNDLSSSSNCMQLQEQFDIKPIDFADMLLTNDSEGGTEITSYRVFAPREISNGPKCTIVKASNFITCNCLLGRIEWRYTSGFPYSTKPRIGYLKVWDLCDEKGYEITAPCENLDVSRIVEVQPHEVNDEIHSDKLKALKNGNVADDEAKDKLQNINPVYRLRGVYIITLFECAESVTKLRVCGSKTATDFAAALDTYSLWDLDSGAVHKLKEFQNAEGGDKEKESSQENV
mmetsp:Transcript_23488/g.35539  ORF Transcript_23488/g.35539 Transcript_23488/m.35539 type:complete len:635 (+) Transcript_23488:145-2049(+)